MRLSGFAFIKPLLISTTLIILLLASVVILQKTKNITTHPKQQSQKSQLTTQFEDTLITYNTLTAKEQERRLPELIGIAKQRQAYLATLMAANQQQFSKELLPQEEINAIPQEVLPYIEKQQSLSGRYVLSHIDTFNTNKNSYVGILTTPTDSFTLHFSSKQPPAIPPGATYTLQGIVVGHDVLVQKTVTVYVPPSISAASAANGTKKIAVLLVNFSNNNAQPFTKAQIQQTVFGATDSVSAYYDETSYHNISYTGDVSDWLTSDNPEPACNFSTIIQDGFAAAQKAGMDLSQYASVVIVTPQESVCSGTGGAGTVGAGLVAPNYVPDVWINGHTSAFYYTHELGHNLGLNHASALQCPQPNNYSNCTTTPGGLPIQDEYGDKYDTMAAGTFNQLNGAHKAALGWVNPQLVTASSTVTLAPLETQSSTTQVIKIAKKDQPNWFYYVEYRKNVGLDQTMPSGVLVHLWSEQDYQVGYPWNTFVINPTSPVMQDGQSITDTVNNIAIQQVSHDANSAVVQISLGGVTPTTTQPTATPTPTGSQASPTPSPTGALPSPTPTASPTMGPQDMPVLELAYFPPDPTDAMKLDPTETGWSGNNWGGRTIKAWEDNTQQQSDHYVQTINNATKYHGYKDQNAPAFLHFHVLDSKTFLTPIPPGPIKIPWDSAVRPYYKQILTDNKICDYVDNKNVKEVWIFSYHTSKIEPDESRMSSQYGDISNSAPKESDIDPQYRLPLCQHTYVLYNFTYQPSDTANPPIGNMIHDRMHQIENEIPFTEGITQVDSNTAKNSLFWGSFSEYIQSDTVHNYNSACGNAHYPPNWQTLDDQYKYDLQNYRLNNCESWNPDKSKTTYVSENCTTWNCNDVGFYTWYMQNIPGYHNGVIYQGKQMRNWWEAIANFDTWIAKGRTLYENISGPTPTGSQITPTPTTVQVQTVHAKVKLDGYPVKTNTTKVFTVTFLDATTNMPTGSTPVLFTQAQDGTFSAAIDVPNRCVNKTNCYMQLQVKADGYLRKTLPDAITFQGSTDIKSTVTLKPGDINGDNIIDTKDFLILTDCTKQPAGKLCQVNNYAVSADFNADGKVDILDYNIFIQTLSTYHGD